MSSKSTASILKDIIAQPECPSCVVITAPDRVRRERSLEYLLRHFNKSTSRPLTFSFGEQGRTNPAVFIRDLSEPSLFEPHRFAVMRGIESARAADTEPVADFISKGIPGAHIFIVGAALPNIPTFKKLLEKKAIHLTLEPLKGAELSRWVEREVKQAGISGVDDAVVELLLSVGNDDPEAITQVVEKFSMYLGDQPATVAALRSLEPGKTTASDFELAESMLGKNRAATETLLAKLFDQGSSPFMLIGLLTKTFGTLLRLRLLMDKGVSQGDIKNDLGISPWLFSKYLPLAKRVPPQTFLRALSALMVADFKLKDKSLGPNAVFSSLAAGIQKEL